MDSFVYVRTIEQGNVVRWYGINADIDDRKRAGQKLKKDERDLQTTQAKESLQRSLNDHSCPVALHEPLNEALHIVARRRGRRCQIVK